MVVAQVGKEVRNISKNWLDWDTNTLPSNNAGVVAKGYPAKHSNQTQPHALVDRW